MRIRRSGFLGLVVVAGLLVGCDSERKTEPIPDGPIEWSASVEADKTRVQVGEDLTLTVRVTHPVDENFIAPYGDELAPFELIERIEDEVSPVEARIVYRIAAYRLPERLTIPSLSIQYRVGDALQELTTEPIDIDVVTSLTPDVTEIHDIKDPVELETPTPWSALWWLLLALAVALLAYYVYRRFAREPEVEARPAPPSIPPDEEALTALRRLKEQRLLDEGETRRYYDDLAEILKRYAGRRYDVPHLERTTYEILSDLRPRKIREISFLRELLQMADLVKFAKFAPPIEDGRHLLDGGREFVVKTRPRRVASEPAAEPKERTA